MNSTPNARESFRFLRLVCRDFSERLILGDAIKNGWNAEAITDLAEADRQRNRTPKEVGYRHAISRAASQVYVTPEQRAAWRAEHEAIEDAIRAREAIKATKDTRPSVPKEFAVFSAACRNMHECDQLSFVIGYGWTATDLLTIAKGWSVNAEGKPTPAALRFAISSAGPVPGDHMFLRSTQKPKPHQANT